MRRVELELHAGGGARRLELLLGASALLGRDPACQLALPAPAAQRHLRVEHRLSGVLVECLAAPAWTIGQERLDPGQRRALAAGELGLALGALRLTIRIALPGGAPAGTPELPGLVLERKLGAGAMGEVWAGRLLRTGEAVAVKLIDVAGDAELGRRVEREAGLSERLVHPGIARIVDLFAAGARLVLVRELIHGPTLAELLAKGPLACRDAVRLGAEVARALAHAHAQGVVHRDVKPENVLVGPDGRARLIDFDLARVLDPASAVTRLTASGQGLGTLAYLAPEQLAEARAADPRADVYGLGATLFHALAGRAPHALVEPEELFLAIRRGPQPLRSVAPHVPPAVAAIVDRACLPEPSRRWADARSLAVALASA